MPEDVMDQLTEVEKRVSKLEDIEKSNSILATEIRNTLRKIEILLVGEPDLNSVGLISTIKNQEKQINTLTKEFIDLKGSFDKSQEEQKKYKWYLKGSITVIGIIIAWGLKLWELFIK